MQNSHSLSIVVLTHNEQIHLERLLLNLRQLRANVFVVNSFSTDNTVAIARDFGAHVVQHEFVNHSQQFQWAIENLSIETEWVMRFDADEVLTLGLAEEIITNLPLLAPEITGVNLNRRHIFFNRWIKHGGRYPLTLLRIWRNGAAKIEQRWMDEHMVLLRGRAITFKNDFFDQNSNDLTFFTDKHNKYATREAIDVLKRRYHLADASAVPNNLSASPQASTKRLIKECVYNRLPLWLGPIGYFGYRYFLQLGFLDGTEGLIYHFLQSFWYRFLVAAKVREYDRMMRDLPDRESQAGTLARLTGYRLADMGLPGAENRT